MSRRIVTVTETFEIQRLNNLTIWRPKWREIPVDHVDPEIRRFYPGKFCHHPISDMTFIFPMRKNGSKSKNFKTNRHQ